MRRFEDVEFPAHSLDGGPQQPGVHLVRFTPVRVIEPVQTGKKLPVRGSVAGQCGGGPVGNPAIRSFNARNIVAGRRLLNSPPAKEFLCERLQLGIQAISRFCPK